MMTLEELNEAIIAWADAKGILEKATPLTQAEKTAEEVEELIRAVQRRSDWSSMTAWEDQYSSDEEAMKHEIRDAIGDIYVTLVIGLKMRDMPCNYVNEQVATKNTCDWHVTRITKCLTAMNCGSRTLEYHTMMVMMDSLKSVAALHSTTLRACVQQAYDVIAKRTGKMVDGVFVKDQP
jgi:NTP pyrophosphatase (non-canonical NTP hydrolase)